MTKILNCFLPFIICFFLLSEASGQTVNRLKEISFEDTPIFKCVKNEEEFYLQTFPNLYVELTDISDVNDLESIIRLVRDKDFSVCLDSSEDIKNFCSLYITLFLMGTESGDLEQFYNLAGPISDIARVGRSISYAINGNIEEAKESLKGVKDRDVINYFKNYISIFDGHYTELLHKTKFSSCDEAKIFNIANTDFDFLMLLIRKANISGYINFLVGKKYFYDRDYLSAGQYFLNASKTSQIKNVAMENAFYAFLNTNNWDMVEDIILRSEASLSEKLTTIAKLKHNKIKTVPEKFLKDEIFAHFLLEHAKQSLKKGADISYLREIESTDLNEELAFIIVIAKLVSGKEKEVSNYVKRVNWKNKFFAEVAFQLVEPNTFFSEENSKIKYLIEAYNLFNYYPFNFIYANMIKDQNADFAKRLYEHVIRYHRNIRKKNLLMSHINLALIYKEEGNYYTALKIIEDALNLSPNEDVKERLIMEMIRIYAKKEDFGELKWRSEAAINEVKNPEYKKELQIFINLCYEKLKLTKESEKK